LGIYLPSALGMIPRARERRTDVRQWKQPKVSVGDIMVVPCTVSGFHCIFCSLPGDGWQKRKADEI